LKAEVLKLHRSLRKATARAVQNKGCTGQIHDD